MKLILRNALCVASIALSVVGISLQAGGANAPSGTNSVRTALPQGGGGAPAAREAVQGAPGTNSVGGVGRPERSARVLASSIASAPRRLKTPGPDDKFDLARTQMVTNQLAAPGRGIMHKALEAMMEVPRHQFVPAESLADSYEDKAVTVGFGRKMDAPFVTASVLQELDLKATDRVLELGTGSGYQAAVLSRVAKEVYTVDSVEELATAAGVNYKRLGYTNNLFVRKGELAEGWSEAAPFDAIVVNTELENIPMSQLKEGGRVVVTMDKDGNQQVLKKSGGALSKQESRLVRVPPAASNKVTLGPTSPIRQKE